MSREIKYRGLTISGYWVIGNYSYIEQSLGKVKPGHYISNDVGMPFAYYIRPETLGQYIEANDNNDKEIFEGDIMQCKLWDDDDYPGTAIVKHSGAHGYYLDYSHNPDTFPEDFSDKFYKHEVVGNIHQNPELIKQL